MIKIFKRKRSFLKELIKQSKSFIISIIAIIGLVFIPYFLGILGMYYGIELEISNPVHIWINGFAYFCLLSLAFITFYLLTTLIIYSIYANIKKANIITRLPATEDELNLFFKDKSYIEALDSIEEYFTLKPIFSIIRETHFTKRLSQADSIIIYLKNNYNEFTTESVSKLLCYKVFED